MMTWANAYVFLRPVRVFYSFLAFANTILVVIAMRVSINSDNINDVSFKDFEQIIINGGFFVVCFYAHFFNVTWTWSALSRAIVIVVVCGLSILYSITLIVSIQEYGGCSNIYFAGVTTRCNIQYAISSIELLWSVLLAVDGTITVHRLQDVDWQNKTRAEEEERAQESVIRYQPDLSLYGNGNGNGDGNDFDGGVHSVPTELEMEPLPPYMPKAGRGQPRIMDMASQASPQEDLTYCHPPTGPPPVDIGHGSGSTSSSAGPPSQATESEVAPAPAPTLAPADAGLPSYAP